MVATALLLSGCSAGADDAAADAKSESVTMLQPGKPGEPARTIGADELPKAPEWSHPDVAFMQMMIPHHAQALEMTELAQTRAQDPEVKALARRIEGAQGPEILTLSSWLHMRKLEVPRKDDDVSKFDHGKHGHMAMEGMLTKPQMKQLASLRGAAFDRMFLQRMIGHHEGAVHMAEAVGAEGTDVQVELIAGDVQTGQQAEIDRMRQMLKEL